MTVDLNICIGMGENDEKFDLLEHFYAPKCGDLFMDNVETHTTLLVEQSRHDNLYIDRDGMINLLRLCEDNMDKCNVKVWTLEILKEVISYCDSLQFPLNYDFKIYLL